MCSFLQTNGADTGREAAVKADAATAKVQVYRGRFAVSPQGSGSNTDLLLLLPEHRGESI